MNLFVAFYSFFLTHLVFSNGLSDLYFTETFHDFGVSTQGQKLVHEFFFENKGQENIKIHGVHVSCGCTVVTFTKDKIYKPREKGSIKIELDTSNFNTPITKAVTILSNDELAGNKTITLKTDVKAEFVISPPVVDFELISSNESLLSTYKNKFQKVEIKPVSGFNLDIIKMEYNEDLFIINLNKNSKNIYTLDVSLKKPKKAGKIQEHIALFTNSKNLQISSIQVRGEVVGDIFLDSNYLEFGSVENKAKSEKILTARSKKNEDFYFEASRVEISLNGHALNRPEDYVSVSAATAVNKKDTKQVIVSLKNTTPKPGSIHGKIFFKTDDPLEQELKVDFYAFFR